MRAAYLYSKLHLPGSGGMACHLVMCVAFDNSLLPLLSEYLSLVGSGVAALCHIIGDLLSPFFILSKVHILVLGF